MKKITTRIGAIINSLVRFLSDDEYRESINHDIKNADEAYEESVPKQKTLAEVKSDDVFSLWDVISAKKRSGYTDCSFSVNERLINAKDKSYYEAFKNEFTSRGYWLEEKGDDVHFRPGTILVSWYKKVEE